MYIRPLRNPDDYDDYNDFVKDAYRWLKDCEKTHDHTLEELFLLTYHMKLDGGFVERMTPKDRRWFIKRLNKQFEDEAEAQRKAMKKR